MRVEVILRRARRGVAWILAIGSRHEDRELIGFKQFLAASFLLNKEPSVIFVVFALTTACFGAGEPEIEGLPWLKAPGLKRGDTIALIMPAGPAELVPLRKFATQIEQAGYKVVFPAGGERRVGYLAGTDDQRAD